MTEEQKPGVDKPGIGKRLWWLLIGKKKPRDPNMTRGQRLLSLVKEWGVTLLLVAVAWQVIGYLRAPDLPDQAPDFALPALNGDVVKLSDYHGKTVVLNFWAEWCMPCRAEIPSFRSYAHDHPDVVVLGVAADGNLDSVRAAAKDLGIDYPVVVADKQTLSAYGVSTLPTSVFVGPKGDVLYAHTGIMVGPQIAWAARER